MRWWMGMLAAALLSCSSGAEPRPGHEATGGALAGGGNSGRAGTSGSAARAGVGGAGGRGGQDAAARAGVGGDAGGRSQAGSGAGGVGAGHSGSDASGRCSDAALTWKTANKTNYTSYPDPGSDECIKFSGCEYEGQFAACDGVRTQTWVSQHNIVAIFPDLKSYQLHDLCLRKGDGSNAIVVTVYDTCGDADCDGCCTQNRGSADALIDVEHYTDQRWGVADGAIEWSDLGPTTGTGCDGK
jgi:hypothetical protein